MIQSDGVRHDGHAARCESGPFGPCARPEREDARPHLRAGAIGCCLHDDASSVMAECRSFRQMGRSGAHRSWPRRAPPARRLGRWRGQAPRPDATRWTRPLSGRPATPGSTSNRRSSAAFSARVRGRARPGSQRGSACGVHDVGPATLARQALADESAQSRRARALSCPARQLARPTLSGREACAHAERCPHIVRIHTTTLAATTWLGSMPPSHGAPAGSCSRPSRGEADISSGGPGTARLSRWSGPSRPSCRCASPVRA